MLRKLLRRRTRAVRAAASRRRRALPNVREGFIRTHYAGNVFLNNPMVLDRIKRGIKESFRKGVEVSTTFYEAEGKLQMTSLKLVGPEGGTREGVVLGKETTSIFSPNKFIFGFHTHLKKTPLHEETELLSHEDLKYAAGSIGCLAVLPLFKRNTNKVNVEFIFSMFPKNFDPESYGNRKEQVRIGRRIPINAEIQQQILKEMGVRFYSIKVPCYESMKGFSFSKMQRANIVKALL